METLSFSPNIEMSFTSTYDDPDEIVRQVWDYGTALENGETPKPIRVSRKRGMPAMLYSPGMEIEWIEDED